MREFKDLKIAVAGTGYVGLSIATLLSQNNEVVALDIIPEKVEMINKGISPIKDEYIEDYLKNKNLNLRATLDYKDAFKDAEFIVISTPTNYDDEKNFFDTSIVEDIIQKFIIMNILNEIAEKTRERIERDKKEMPREDLINEIRQKKVQMLLNPLIQSETAKTPHSFYQALKKPGMSYICEVKKASPSKGLIAPDFPYLEIAKEYKAAGAAAISCLTEPFYFQGSDQYLWEIASEVDIPVLRKDFVIDDYMILQAAAYGAAAVLLICALLDDKQLREYREMAEDLGMDALVEAHDEEEVERAIKSGARIIGVNNRDLKTFEVDMQNSIRLRKLAPDNVIFVSESGIRTSEDIKKLHENQIEAVLIGETLMRSPDKKAALEELNGAPLEEA